MHPTLHLSAVFELKEEKTILARLNYILNNSKSKSR